MSVKQGSPIREEYRQKTSDNKVRKRKFGPRTEEGGTKRTV